MLPPTCLATESAALTATAAALDERFVAAFRAVERTVAAGRKLILSGVGKSAHIAEKIVGTLNSIGAPSLFLDATQALHGDLGLCTEGDLAILVSNSGQTEELVRLCERRRVKLLVDCGSTGAVSYTHLTLPTIYSV